MTPGAKPTFSDPWTLWSVVLKPESDVHVLSVAGNTGSRCLAVSLGISVIGYTKQLGGLSVVTARSTVGLIHRAAGLFPKSGVDFCHSLKQRSIALIFVRHDNLRHNEADKPVRHLVYDGCSASDGHLGDRQTRSSAAEPRLASQNDWLPGEVARRLAAAP